jgi:WhiB family redox-sensing transcriptional regulator
MSAHNPWHTRHQAPGTWANQAACTGQGPDMVMPGTPRGSTQARANKRHIANAKQYCNTCPVLEQCRTWALTDPDPAEGLIAGGLTPNERRHRRNGLRSNPG